jgi:caspase domain-containing protein
MIPPRDDGQGRQNVRTALLIGVPHYDSQDFPTIPTVANDLHQLQLVLESSGYEVRVYPDCADDQESAHELVTGSRIVDELRTACEEAPEGSVLFLYFSGHGISSNGRDYLVPADVRSLEAARHDQRFLADVDISPYLTNCKARAIIFAIDACRENVGQVKGYSLSEPPEFGSGAIDPEHKTRVALIYGCDKGQFCHFSEELKMSLFTKALCTVLSPEHPAQSLSEVITKTDEVLVGLVRKYRKGSVQRVHALHEGGVGSIDGEVICEGSAFPWRTAVRESSLWQLSINASADEREKLTSVAQSVAVDAWRHWQSVAGQLPEDPWRDPDYAIRCLAALELLVPNSPSLSIAEILVLTTAPFLAEAAHMEGIQRLLPHEPLIMSASLTGDPLRQELEAVHTAYSRIRDKAVALAQAQPTDAEAVATWLMHRHTFRQVRLWEEQPVDHLAQTLAAGLDRRTGFRNESARAILGIASLLGTGGEELEAFLQGSAEGVRAAAAKATRLELHGGNRTKIRGPVLSVLLSLAGMLALDPRRLSNVVVDHIGIRDALDPADLRRAVREAKWELSEDRTAIGLVARCTHPAIHLALQEVCAAVQHQLQAAHRWSRDAGKDDGPVEALPVSVSTDELLPEVGSGGRPVYETPLLQFRLAHNEVRDLLMGVRLYGDPALAVRELYQNALDACRYRRVRATYRNRAYDGTIRIVQGVEDGRRYLECVDNGVGMGRGELENTFSRAGRRFVTSTAFLWEQAEWLRQNENLRLWPNSQFGIGVFSYFMLADEIFVETAQTDPVTDAPGELLHVRISSSGSLFRITKADRGPGQHNNIAATGGTRVRLYLRELEETEISCVSTLDKLLWYSEFDVEAIHGSESRRWTAGVLNPPTDVSGWENNAAPDVWWVENKGALLADGIAADATPFGYVVNLCGENRPALSTDRNRLEGWNKAWVQDQLRVAARVLPDFAKLDFFWLQRLAKDEPLVAQQVTSELIRRGAALPADVLGVRSSPVNVRDVGVWPFDSTLIVEPYSNTRRDADMYIRLPPFMWQARKNYVEASRRRTWMQAGVTNLVPQQDYGSMGRFADDKVWALPADTRGHPRLEPLDFAIMTGDGYDFEERLAILLELSQRTRTRVSVLLRRVRRFLIHGAEVPPDLGSRLEFVATDVDIRLVRALRYGKSGPLVAATTESHRTGQPFASMIDRLNIYADLGLRIARITYRADPAYICAEPDVKLLRAAPWHIGINGGHAAWLHLLLDPTVDAHALDSLMRSLHAPVDLLKQLAGEARADSVLAKLLSKCADSAQAWLLGNVSLTHLLIGSVVLNKAPVAVAELIAPYQAALRFRLPVDLSTLPSEPIPERAANLLRELERPVDVRRRLPPDEERGAVRARGALIARLSYKSGLDPLGLVETLAPFRAFLPIDLPSDPSRLPAHPPTDRELTLLESVVDNRRHVRVLIDQWAVPTRDGGSWRQYDEDQFGDYREEDLASLDAADRQVLSADITGDPPYLCGTLSAIHVAKVAQNNEETIAKTIERITQLARVFPISAPDIEWGELRHAPLPPLVRRIEYEAVEAVDIVGLARSHGLTVAQILRRFKPIAEALTLPDFDNDELGRLEIVPDVFDLVAVAPINDWRTPDARIRPDILHVLRVAGRLGCSIGEITARIKKFELLLAEAPPPITAEVESHVPDWRDLVILTAELDGRRLITDEDIRNGHVERAARETETTAEDVRTRLRRYATYCGFTMPGE